ncbi:MAG: CopG family transcriptional regulator [Candidatus Methylomirabilales bacterium]
MPRKTRILRFVIPQGLRQEYETLAKELGKTKSELFREMLAVFRARKNEEDLLQLQRRIARQLDRRKRPTEAEIDRIVFEDR